jgi:hypothetical protein
MNCIDNPLRDLHEALAHAQYEGVSDIEYDSIDLEASQKAKTTEERIAAREKKIPKSRRPWSGRDFWVYAMFPQTWGSTALGHGGMGGASMTTAYTIVLECPATQEFLVYFGGQLCYKVDRRGKNLEVFTKDLAERNLASKKQSEKYQ